MTGPSNPLTQPSKEPNISFEVYSGKKAVENYLAEPGVLAALATLYNEVYGLETYDEYAIDPNGNVINAVQFDTLPLEEQNKCGKLYTVDTMKQHFLGVLNDEHSYPILTAATDGEGTPVGVFDARIIKNSELENSIPNQVGNSPYSYIASRDKLENAINGHKKANTKLRNSKGMTVYAADTLVSRDYRPLGVFPKLIKLTKQAIDETTTETPGMMYIGEPMSHLEQAITKYFGKVTGIITENNLIIAYVPNLNRAFQIFSAQSFLKHKKKQVTKLLNRTQ